jgi:DNA-binding NarL/FixJ family response regulator
VAAVEPIPIYRDGLSTLVHRTHGLHWVGHAASHHYALQLSEQLRPEVMLVDSGLDPHCHLVKLLTSGDSGLLVLAVVRESLRNADYLAAVMAAGARGAVPRSAEPRRLVEVVYRMQTERYLDPALSALTPRAKRQPPRPRGQQQDAKTPMNAQRSAVPVMPLSRREYQVLQLLAEGLENAAIAKLLYLSVETVRTHVKSILRKLSARDRTHAVTTAFRLGILIIQPNDTVERFPVLPRTRSTPEG